jgi:NADH:ubiquinone oxidoreductase subunit 2 (subunit N)
VALALGASCVSLFYYLQVLKQVWVAPAAEGQGKIAGGRVVGLLIVLLAAVVLVVGVAPELLIRFLK